MLVLKNISNDELNMADGQRQFMDIQEQNVELQQNLNQSNLLAKTAYLEISKSGHTNVKCPKCQSSPQLFQEKSSNRRTLSCECGYIVTCEIIF